MASTVLCHATPAMNSSERSMGILIRNGTVVTADRVEKADVLIEGSTIREVRASVDPKGHTVVDAAGLFVLPGGIDAHTHMDMPFGGTVSADDFLTGTRAAAIGGTTTIVDFAIQAKGTRMRDALDIWGRRPKVRPASAMAWT